ncbi:hypothetical protein FB451DRAFT_701291 [Mycena latifolia]|nr:hypothetical protein FB451DRAFT_701291 [Mycena latifolia]
MDRTGGVQSDWTPLYSRIIQLASSLFFNGIYILLAVFALYFLLRRRSPGRHVFICAIVVLGIFAIAQMLYQVVITAWMLQIYSGTRSHETVAAALANYASILHLELNALRWGNFLLLLNNFAADSLLIYRCYMIWSESRYKIWVAGLPLILLILTTTFGGVTIAMGNFHTCPSVFDDLLIVVLGMIATNLLLISLTAGRIWSTRRHLRVIGQPTLLQRCNTAITMLLESGALYFGVNLTLLVVPLTGGSAALDAPGLAVLYGAYGQLLNIIPAVMIVRISLKRSADIDPTAQINLKLESTVY